MSTICGEQHKLYPSHQLFSPKNKHFKDVDIPPRKLLTNKSSFQDSSPDFESNLQKFLPCNDFITTDNKDDQDLDPYSSDHFRMYEFKVRRCTRSRSHDWTDCPFAHPGEKALRRDPRKYHYSGAVCPEFRRGGCSRGDSCEFAHGVFECWLHPSRYRTEACKDGKNCKRKVCFFAHSPRQLRLLSDVSSCGGINKQTHSHNHNHCCCHSVISSPTSTLLGMSHMSPPLSPSLSPPLSPQRSLTGFSPISRYNDRLSNLRSGIVSYKDVLTELMTSLEAMNFDAAAASPNRHINSSIPWIDIASLNGDDYQQQQFILSPSTPNGNFFNRDCSSSNNGFINNIINDKANNNGGAADPDLGWVNELLM